jgi:hypothetical protein
MTKIVFLDNDVKKSQTLIIRKGDHLSIIIIYGEKRF